MASYNILCVLIGSFLVETFQSETVEAPCFLFVFESRRVLLLTNLACARGNIGRFFYESHVLNALSLSRANIPHYGPRARLLRG